MTADKLVHRLKKGDKSAFRDLVDEYSSTLMAIALRYMKDHALAQDALQESLIKIFRKIQLYDGKGSFEGWLKRVTVNTCLEQLRKKKDNILYIENYEVHNNSSVGPEVIDHLDEQAILKIIDRIPEHYRIIFNLAIVEGYSHYEIGEMLGIAESTSRTKLVRARAMVKEFFLSEKHDDELRSTRKAH